MPEISEFQAIPIKTLLGDLTNYKYNPSLIQRRILDHLEDITLGQIDIVDPTNPFIFLLEASSVNAALCNQENTLHMNALYPQLAKTEDDLYRHMSDQDYYDRFATPATATFTMMLHVPSMLNSMVEVPSERLYKLTIPRNTEVTIDGMTFSLQFPVDIIRYYSGILEVRYDASQLSPFQSLSTNIISYTVRIDAEQVKWVSFPLPLQQFYIESTEFSLQLGRPFVEDCFYRDQYMATRVYYRMPNSTVWKEMRTTHSDQVYDPFTPTAVLTVYEGSVKVFIPPIYIHSGQISGDVRVDVYGTLGAIEINFSNYDVEQFQVNLRAIDEVNDTSIFTNAMSNVSYRVLTDQTVVSGAKPVSLDELRKAVVWNSIGDRTLPITPTQIYYDIDRKGFELFKNIDVVTNRIFAASKSIPRSYSRYPVTPMAFTIWEYINSIEQLKLFGFIKDHNTRITVPSYSLFEMVENKLRLLTEYDRAHLEGMSRQEYLGEVNNRTFLCNPFHYVLDFENDEFDMRAYSLDYPSLNNLNFVAQNSSLAIAVNTNQYAIRKYDWGYRLLLTTKSGSVYQDLYDNVLGCQIAFKIENENNYGYLEGELIGRSAENERIWQFDIQTTFDVDADDLLQINNFQISTNPNIILPMALTQNILIFHYTKNVPDDFKPIQSDQLFGRFMIDVDAAVITHETMDIEFGLAMANMWRHYRSHTSGMPYKTYTMDVPMTYEEDVYRVDPQTGLIFQVEDDCTVHIDLLHPKGSIVYDDENQIVYKYKAGDVMLDNQGNPIRISDEKTIHFMDLILMDYKHHAATRQDHKTYKDDVIAAIEKWVTIDLADIDKQLLEQTRIFFKPYQAMGTTLVMIRDGVHEYIDMQQSFTVKYYVNNATMNNTRIREAIEYRSTEIFNEEISKARVSISDIITRLKTEFDSTVDSIAVEGLGGEYKLDVVYLDQPGQILSLKKRLVSDPDGSLIVKEDITFEFIDIEQG